MATSSPATTFRDGRRPEAIGETSHASTGGGSTTGAVAAASTGTPQGLASQSAAYISPQTVFSDPVALPQGAGLIDESQAEAAADAGSAERRCPLTVSAKVPAGAQVPCTHAKIGRAS